MKYRTELKPRAEKDLKTIPKGNLEKIVERLHALEFIFPYEEFVEIQRLLEDLEDLQELRDAKSAESTSPTRPLADVLAECDERFQRI